MKERSILFNAPMVRAILDGSKTQTRRVAPLLMPGEKKYIHAADDAEWMAKRSAQCPFGQPGDHLYVRETWQHSNHPYGHADESCDIFYRADYWDDPHGMDGEKSPEGKYREWRPSIHMPRWASRIQLEITGVRVERLQEISEEDALSEGVTLAPCHPRHADKMGRAAYRELWESINGPGSWDVNPWLWVVEFKMVKGGAL